MLIWFRATHFLEAFASPKPDQLTIDGFLPRLEHSELPDVWLGVHFQVNISRQCPTQASLAFSACGGENSCVHLSSPVILARLPCL